MSEFVICERDGDATRITINRPDAGGQVTDEMAAEMADMIDAAAGDSKFIVLRSAGDDFCTGRDRGGRPASPPKDALELIYRLKALMDGEGDR